MRVVDVVDVVLLDSEENSFDREIEEADSGIVPALLTPFDCERGIGGAIITRL